MPLLFGPGGQGSALDVFYRRASLGEVCKMLLGMSTPPNPYYSVGAMDGRHIWSTPVLFSGLDRSA